MGCRKMQIPNVSSSLEIICDQNLSPCSARHNSLSFITHRYDEYQLYRVCLLDDCL
ncbi:hypothetical protein BS47DRAFT_1355252 [Hydnum rufescens UP504]|uniref:Uncharacterized protein n=1 Tax=Hydnum rufescens UP504 TaxID=1448309 RepID=A0A9P6AGA6_9AGAM|nr:hypothetical protein BS47DRAFT_1355252 [Hydnum rufescens UP504]